MRDVPNAHVSCWELARTRPSCANSPSLGVTDRVTITHIPPVDRAGMAGALAESSVVAALSDYEGASGCDHGGLSVGRPIVAYDIAGTGELVSEGWVRGVAPGAPPSSVARSLVEAMSAPSAGGSRGVPRPGMPALSSSRRSTWRRSAVAPKPTYHASCRWNRTSLARVRAQGSVHECRPSTNALKQLHISTGSA